LGTSVKCLREFCGKEFAPFPLSIRTKLFLRFSASDAPLMFVVTLHRHIVHFFFIFFELYRRIEIFDFKDFTNESWRYVEEK